MKKRILSLALALMLALSLLPMAALAAEDEPTGEIVATPIEEPAEEPDEEPVEEPVVEPTPEPTEEPEEELCSESTEEPTAEPTPEPTAAPEEKSTDEAAPFALDGGEETVLAEAVQNGTTVNITSFNDLVGAFQSSKTSKITLRSDTTIDASYSSITIVSPELTLDLNGYELSFEPHLYVGIDNGAFTTFAKLTITNGSAAKTGVLEMPSNLYVQFGSSLNISGGKLEISKSIYVRGSMKVSGTAEVFCSSPLYVESFYGSTAASLVVAGGTVHGTVDVSGRMDISAGTVDGTVILKAGKLISTGGAVSDKLEIQGGRVRLSGGTFGQVQTETQDGLTDFLADGYAYYEKAASESQTYDRLLNPNSNNDISDVQVKAHECEFDFEGSAPYHCQKGCGRSYANDPVPYLDETGDTRQCAQYTEVTANLTTWESGWYVVKDSVELASVSIADNATVNLILCDGKTLTVKDGVDGHSASLTVYGQTRGTGALTVTAKDSEETDLDAYVCAMDVKYLTVNGGAVTATAGNATTNGGDARSYGIYVDYDLVVNGGTLTANAGSATSSECDAKSYGIYVDMDLIVNGGSLTGNGGSVESTEDEAKSFGIYVDVDLIVNGGSVAATSSNAQSDEEEARSYAIYTDDDFIVTGGSVTATAGDAESNDESAYSEGIRVEDDLSITGGLVTATAGDAQSSEDYAGSYGLYTYYYFDVYNATLEAYGGDAASEEDDACSCGIYTGYYRMKMGYATITATAKTATAEGEAGSYGIWTDSSITMTDSSAEATAGDAQSETYRAESYGIGADDDVTAYGGSVTAAAGTATAYSSAQSCGIWTNDSMEVQGCSVEATAGNAQSEDSLAESYGIYANYALTVNDSSIEATAGDAQSDKNDAYSNGIYVSTLFVDDSLITATAGTAADDEYDIYTYWDFVVSGDTVVQSGNAGGAIRVCAEPLEVYDGTIKLRDSYLYQVSAFDGVKLADLLADGYAYWDDEEEVFLALSELGSLSSLDEIYVKPCAHSTSDGVCAYCGKDLTAKPDATPAPTAKAAQSPRTGDEANVAVWLALATMSIIGIALVARKKAK